jgi:hypothetical protein
MYGSVPIGPDMRAARSKLRATLRSISRGGTPMMMLAGFTSRWTVSSSAM